MPSFKIMSISFCKRTWINTGQILCWLYNHSFSSKNQTETDLLYTYHQTFFYKGSHEHDPKLYNTVENNGIVFNVWLE